MSGNSRVYIHFSVKYPIFLAKILSIYLIVILIIPGHTVVSQRGGFGNSYAGVDNSGV